MSSGAAIRPPCGQVAAAQPPVPMTRRECEAYDKYKGMPGFADVLIRRGHIALIDEQPKEKNHGSKNS